MGRLWGGLLAGAAAGCALTTVALIGRIVDGVPTLPDLVQDRLVLLLPGPVFALLLERFLYLGKPLLFAGLLLAQVAIGAVLGMALLRARHVVIATFVAALALWLVLGLVLLPLAGNGPFARDRGVAATIFAGCVAYAVTFLLLLPRAEQPAAPTPRARSQRNAVQFFVQRRRLLAGGLLGLSTAVLTRRAIGSLPALPPRGASAAGGGTSGGTAQAGTQAGLPPPITPVNRFYVVTKNLLDPKLSGSSWSLRVDGMVLKPLKLSYADLLAMPPVAVQRTLECISNEVGGDLISTGNWTGVRLVDLLQRAGVLQGATALSLSSADGYSASMTLTQAIDPATLIAYQLDGAPLSQKHGYPARVLGTNTYGMKNPKWLTRIELTRDTRQGFWQQQGWDGEDIVQTMARIDAPGDGMRLPLGPITVAGIAFAGARGISRIELATDGGSTWSDAQIAPSQGANTWTFWQYAWQPAQAGSYTLTVRATDGTGTVQPSRRTDTYPTGATGYDAIHLKIGG
jgi:DMSO/TMAO reductase YedYZ molybdopterin-dependent catalytic subunit